MRGCGVGCEGEVEKGELDLFLGVRDIDMYIYGGSSSASSLPELLCRHIYL
jgi:hypothetical protein